MYTILIRIQMCTIVCDVHVRICVTPPGAMFCRNRLATSEAECISVLSRSVIGYENRSALCSVASAVTEQSCAPDRVQQSMHSRVENDFYSSVRSGVRGKCSTRDVRSFGRHLRRSSISERHVLDVNHASISL